MSGEDANATNDLNGRRIKSVWRNGRAFWDDNTGQLSASEGERINGLDAFWDDNTGQLSVLEGSLTNGGDSFWDDRMSTSINEVESLGPVENTNPVSEEKNSKIEDTN